MLAIFALCLAAAGCDSKTKTTGRATAGAGPRRHDCWRAGAGPRAGTTAGGPEKQAIKADMQQLSLAMDIFHDVNAKPPAGIGDLKTHLEGGDRVVKAVESGQLVVNWGRAPPAKWHAYEEDAPIRGGQISVWNAEKRQMVVQDMSADEVKKIIGK